jgi:hypothetical protein
VYTSILVYRLLVHAQGYSTTPASTLIKRLLSSQMHVLLIIVGIPRVIALLDIRGRYRMIMSELLHLVNGRVKGVLLVL